MRVLILFITLITFALGGCVSSASLDPISTENGEIIQDQKIVSQIQSSSTSTKIGEIEYSIESYAWRDFMPIVNPPVRLILKNTLIRSDGDPIESSIEVMQHYVVKGSDIWRPVDVETRQDQNRPGQIEILSRDGPTWETGSKVLVGLKIKNLQTDTIHWLSATEVEIIRTE